MFRQTFFLLGIIAWPNMVNAFYPPIHAASGTHRWLLLQRQQQHQQQPPPTLHTTASFAKRRRKGSDSKNDPQDSEDESSSSLPDFDLLEEDDASAQNASNLDIRRMQQAKTNMDASELFSNTRDLLLQRDRELERKLALLQASSSNNNNKEDSMTTKTKTVESLPSLMEYMDAKNKPLGTAAVPVPAPEKSSKKKDRKPRRDPLPISTLTKKEEPNFFSKLLFGETNGSQANGGGIDWMGKIIENGAWVGIFLLIAWEVYLNSPLFQRQAPLAPFVFRSEPSIF